MKKHKNINSELYILVKLQHYYRRNDNNWNCFGPNSLYYNACNCFPEIALYAYSYARTLFTLFFIQYFPIVAGAFLLIIILEQFYIFKRGKEHRINDIMCEIMLLSGKMIWMWLAFKLAPQMESMLMKVESWNDISVRESFFRFAFTKSVTS